MKVSLYFFHGLLKVAILLTDPGVRHCSCRRGARMPMCVFGDRVDAWVPVENRLLVVLVDTFGADMVTDVRMDVALGPMSVRPRSFFPFGFGLRVFGVPTGHCVAFIVQFLLQGRSAVLLGMFFG